MVQSNPDIKSFPNSNKLGSPLMLTGRTLQVKLFPGRELKTISVIMGGPEIWEPPIPLRPWAWDASNCNPSIDIKETSAPLSIRIFTSWISLLFVIVNFPGTRVPYSHKLEPFENFFDGQTSSSWPCPEQFLQVRFQHEVSSWPFLPQILQFMTLIFFLLSFWNFS